MTEHLLEIVNKIVTVGVTEDLFTPAEKDQIIDDWHKNVNDAASIQLVIANQYEMGDECDTFERYFLFSFLESDAWNGFLNNCNENIHIVMCTTRTETFRMLCRINHGLVGVVYINWMQQWSEKVLMKVANMFLAEHPNIPETYQESIIGHVVHVHKSIHDYSQDYQRKCHRFNFFTPKHYLEFIHNYLKILGASTNSPSLTLLFYYCYCAFPL